MTQTSIETSQNPANWNIYTGAASHYQTTRPSYPVEAVQPIIDALPYTDAPILAVDIGCGTGIFTRCVADLLDKANSVLGVEPNDDMRKQALEASKGYRNIEFLEGSSEYIPIGDEEASLITSASAAHWFNLEKYYKEVSRTLKPKGILAIVQNKRRWQDSEFLAEYEELHEKFLQGYKRGTFPNRFGGFSEETFFEDLEAHSDFSNVRQFSQDWIRTLTRDEFEILSLSTSHTRRAMHDHGEEIVMAELGRILDKHTGTDDNVIIPYVTEVTMAERSTVPS